MKHGFVALSGFPRPTAILSPASFLKIAIVQEAPSGD